MNDRLVMGILLILPGLAMGLNLHTLCKVDKVLHKGEIWMDGVEFSGHDFEYDFDWHHVEYWQLAPPHPDL